MEKKTRRRFISLLTTAALLLGSLTMLSGCGKKLVLSGDYQYRTLRGTAAEIVRYLGSEAEPVIPETLDGRTVTSIGKEAFCGNIRVENVFIPENVESIGDYAFECCSSLRTVALPSTMRRVGEGAFSGCCSLETVSLSDGIESYGDGAFFFCRSLRSFELTPSVRSIGRFAFAECDSLTDLTMSEGLERISDRAFNQCEALSSTDIPASVKYIGDRAFSKCYMLTNVTGGEGVETIAECAFDGDSSLTAYPFSNVLRSVGESAFRSCYSVTKAALPETASDIAPGAFMGINLDDITVAEDNPNYTVVDGVLFSKDMKTLLLYPNGSVRTEYTVPEGVERIAPYAFRCCIGLSKLTLPETLKEIGEYAFQDMHNVAEIVIPDSVTTLGDYCFYCTGFEHIKVGSGVKELSRNAFACCYSLLSIELPETLRVIGEMAFESDECLEKIVVPAGVKEIASSAFNDTYCPVEMLSPEFVITDGMLYSADGKTLYQCLSDSDVKEYVIPDGVERIAPFAFDKFMTSLTVPDSVTDIGENAFGMFRAFRGPDMETSYLKSFCVYCSENSAARRYSEQHDLAFFTSEPNVSPTDIILSGDEISEFVIQEAVPGTVAYTSADPMIAEVDRDGTITAHRAGSTVVIGTVGNCNIRCNVTVTSDGDPENYPELFDDSGYTHLHRGESGTWVENYKQLNADSLIYDQPEKYPFTAAYKGESYYEGMWAAQVENSEYDEIARDMFGDGYHDQLAMMGHGLNVELSRYRQPDSVVLFSGSTGFGRMLGKAPTVKNMQDAIGTVITEPYFFSTALDESVATGFGGDLNCVFEIYADREAIRGGYIECTVGQGDGGEYELLMPANARFEIIDAGVRDVVKTTMNPLWNPEEYSLEERTCTERYMKVRLLDFDGGDVPIEESRRTSLILMSVCYLALIVCVIALTRKKAALPINK